MHPNNCKERKISIMTKRKWNNFCKRGLAMFLALVMCLGMLPAAAFAAGEETITCPTCNGARVVTEPCPDCENGKVSVTSECPDCEEPPVCADCKGTHVVETTKPCPDCLNAEESRCARSAMAKARSPGKSPWTATSAAAPARW